MGVIAGYTVFWVVPGTFSPVLRSRRIALVNSMAISAALSHLLPSADQAGTGSFADALLVACRGDGGFGRYCIPHPAHPRRSAAAGESSVAV